MILYQKYLKCDVDTCIKTFNQPFIFELDNNLTFSRKRGFDSLKNDNSLTLPIFMP